MLEMFKKILLLILAIIFLLFFIKKTNSFFFDKEISTGNTISVGTWTQEDTITPTPNPTLTITPTPSEVNPGNIVINEINWAGNDQGGGANDEWIELRNATDHSVSIGGWIVENLGSTTHPDITITPNTASIPANGFFLISAKNASASRINVDPDMITNDVDLNNDGEQLRLKTDLNILIDSANVTPGAWLAGSNSTPKKSMERKTPPEDGTVSSNWQDAATHTNMDGSSETDEFGTPKAVNDL